MKNPFHCPAVPFSGSEAACGTLCEIAISNHVLPLGCVGQFIDTSVRTGQIESPTEQMALRLSSHLLVGLSRIYTKKVQFLFMDCNEALSKITLVRFALPSSFVSPLSYTHS